MIATRQIKRAGLSILLFAALAIPKAHAGDAASRNIIGFSPDGRSFAFEQYGVQDGSGFEYSEIFIIDTETDRWLPETPIRIRHDKEGLGVEMARKTARHAAQPILQKLKIGAMGDTLARYPAGTLQHEVAIGPVGGEAPLSFSLEEKPFPPGDCGKYTDQPIKGFRLSMGAAVPDTIIHDDVALPATRGCALAYGIADVIRSPAEGPTGYAILIEVQSHGFEGPDTRFIAVTRRLP